MKELRFGFEVFLPLRVPYCYHQPNYINENRQTGAATLDLGSKLDTARKVAINGAAAVAAAAAAGETLTECATGLWSIDGWVDNEIVYPFYRVSTEDKHKHGERVTLAPCPFIIGITMVVAWC